MNSLKSKRYSTECCTIFPEPYSSSVSQLLLGKKKSAWRIGGVFKGRGHLVWLQWCLLSRLDNGRQCRHTGRNWGCPGAGKESVAGQCSNRGSRFKAADCVSLSCLYLLSLWWELIPGEPTNTTENIWLDIPSAGARAKRFLAAVALCR